MVKMQWRQNNILRNIYRGTRNKYEKNKWLFGCTYCVLKLQLEIVQCAFKEKETILFDWLKESSKNDTFL